MNDLRGENMEQVILFDGVCNLCNGVVNFVIDRDKGGKFSFASLQSSYATELLKTHNLPDDLQTIVLIKNGSAYLKSDAALEIARQLGGGWRLLYVFKILPKWLRDIGYNLVARNRYRLFGRKDQCRIPTPALRERFLDAG